MDHEWIQAGFFIISSGNAPVRENRLLPERILTVSTCIVDSYPDAWALPWVETAPDQLRSIQEKIALDNTVFENLRNWVKTTMDNGRFGWPNVFFSVHTAQEFYLRFLGALLDIRIIGLSLSKDVASDFLCEERPQEGCGAIGVWTMVNRGLARIRSGSPLGFDVLGMEFGGGFHTFTCNSLEQDFHDKLGITFNKDGLIDDYSKAIVAAEYTNRDDVGAEPVIWYPFRVDEYPIKVIDK